MAVVVETAVLHLLVSRWKVAVAWVLTGLAMYSIAWLLGDFHAARLNPTLVTKSGLHLRAGLRWRADLGWADIESVHDAAPREPDIRFVLWGKPDFWIECRGPTIVTGPFGLQRRVRFMGVGVDTPMKLREAIQGRLVADELDGHAKDQDGSRPIIPHGHGQITENA